ncbi:MAG TPA: helix-turn-helix domain-containing protein [Blastocatellia bacterium]|nr:helix-turn-helix domain-containing protein [Blastocatellia bacterium]
MQAKKKQTKSQYMPDDDFAVLRQSLNEVLQFVRGERTDLRTTQRLLPPDPEPMPPEDILALRLNLKLSQAVFARLLNVSKKTVQAWEYGARTPGDAALKLLRVAQKHPEVLME